MQFSCGQCGTRYSVPDEKVRGKRVKTRCRKCGADIVLEGAAHEAEPPSAEKPATAGPSVPPEKPGAAPAVRIEERWTVAVSRTEQRKMTTSEIAAAYAAGTISDQTLVWKHGMLKWEAPFSIPAISLALSARGLKPSATPQAARLPSLPPPAPAKAKPNVPPPPASAPKAPSIAAAAASEWDDENEATRVSEGAIPFMARRLLPQQPKKPAPAAPAAKPLPPAAPAVPAAKPLAPKALAHVSTPEEEEEEALLTAGWDEDEATRAVEAPSALLAAARGAKRPAAPDSAALVDTKRPPPSGDAPVLPKMEAPSSVPALQGFSFEDESTAVIAPDRARELLEAEAKKSEAKGSAPEASAETPLAFAFDDESTQVIASDEAEALLEAQAAKTPSERPPGFPEVLSVSPRPPARSESGATRRPDGEGSEPSIVVSPKDGEGKAKGKGKPAQAALTPDKPPDSRAIIAAFQNEPTRVVRVKRRGSQGLWLIVALALVAAAAGGFVASEILARHHTTLPRAP